MFELKLPSGTVQLKWGYYAMKQFCANQGITSNEYFAKITPQYLLDQNGNPIPHLDEQGNKLTDDKGNILYITDSSKPTILDYTSTFLLIGAEYAALKTNSGKTFSEIEVCEWIDEAGGVKADGVIMDYLKYVIASHTTNLSEKEESEKKS